MVNCKLLSLNRRLFLAKSTKICNAKNVKKIFGFFFFIFFFLGLFILPIIKHVEAVGEPCNLVNPNSCPQGLACKPRDSTPNSPLTCQTAGVGDACNLVNPNSCPQGLACKPRDSTPNSPLTCQTAGVGDACNLVNPNSCPPDLACRPRDSTPNSPLTCQNAIKCSCTKPGKAGNGENGFSCTNTRTGVKLENGLYCDGEDNACTNQSGEFTLELGTVFTESKASSSEKTIYETNFKNKKATGIHCIKSSDTQDLPPPTGPPPPCPEGKWDSSKGLCSAFNTGLGEFTTDAPGLIQTVFGLILAFSGAVALFLIMRAGYKIMISQGKPEPLQEGRDQLISAIVGLIFLIFSFVLLQLIGVDLLKIPGFRGVSSAPSGKAVGSACQVQYPDNTSGQGDCANGLSCKTDQSTCTGSICNGICSEDSDDGSKSKPPKKSPDSPDSPSFSACTLKLLKIGSTGPCVTTLQNKLNISPADGIYDVRTDVAVRKFQANKRIYIDGDTGPCTWGKIRNLSVRPICQGPLNETTIRKFQTENGLVIDGVLDGEVNNCTWTAIWGARIPNSCKRK